MTSADLQATIAHMGVAARAAATAMASASTAAKNAALLALARRLRAELAELQTANSKDLHAARAAGLAEPMVDRLKLSEKLVATVAEGCEQIAAPTTSSRRTEPLSAGSQRFVPTQVRVRILIGSPIKE